MPVKVLDTSALISFFEDKPGADRVRTLFEEAAKKGYTLLMCVVNWGEVLYIMERRYGKEKRVEVQHLMEQMHIEIVDAGQELTRIAASFKATLKLSYCDAFAAALAFLKQGVVVTGDKDFERVEKQVSILWL